MGCCVIFCAAEFDALARPLEKDDYILAADGRLETYPKTGDRTERDHRRL